MKRPLYIALGLLLLSNSALMPAESSNVLARLALVSDTHTTRGTNEEQPRYRGRLDQVIAAVNAAVVDFGLPALLVIVIAGWLLYYRAQYCGGGVNCQ